MDASTDARRAERSDGTDDAATRGRRPVAGSRRRFLQLSGLAAAGALAGCLTGGGTNQAGTLEDGASASFRLHWARRSNIYANFTAAEKWTWPQRGLDVSIDTANGSQAAAKSVAGGNDMFGSGGYGAVLQLVENGAPLTVLGTFTGPWGGVVSLKDAGITAWTDLPGTTVGKFPFGSTGPVAKAAMREAGVDPSTVEFQNVQPESGISLLMQGKLDAIVRYVPQTKARLHLNGLEVNALKSGDVLNHLGLAVYAHDDVVAERPAVADAFVGGWLGGMKMLAEQYETVMAAQKEVVDASAWKPKLNEQMRGAVYASQAPPEDVGTNHGCGWVSADRLETTIDVFHDAGLLDSRPSTGDVYTNEFVERNRDLAVETAQALYSRLEEFDVGPDYI